MPSFLPDDLQPVGLRDKHAYAFTIGTLNEESTQDLVDQIYTFLLPKTRIVGEDRVRAGNRGVRSGDGGMSCSREG